MFDSLIKWFRSAWSRIANSIALFPILMAIAFLVVGYFMLELDFSKAGKEFKEQARWMTLKDSETARTIVATIAAGIISLSVFSFSLVMLLLNQTASSMSNRILETLIGNKFQQIVLGFYIGTIVYSFFLLSTIRDIDSQLYIPSLSIYLLIACTIFDIFLFIYFLHYITQSVKYENLIRRIFKHTKRGLERRCSETSTHDYEEEKHLEEHKEWFIYNSDKSGYLQGSREENLVAIAEKHNCCIRIVPAFGSYVLEGTPLWATDTKQSLPEEVIHKVNLQLDIFSGQSIEKNPFYGFQHLMEVGIKALSPGINDPGTAVFCIHALDDLLAFMLNHFMKQIWTNKDGKAAVILPAPTFSELFNRSLLPIWDYGKNDRLITTAMIKLLSQFAYLKIRPEHAVVLRQMVLLIKHDLEIRPSVDPEKQVFLQQLLAIKL